MSDIYEQIRAALLPFVQGRDKTLDIVEVVTWEENYEPGFYYSSYTYEDPHTEVNMRLLLADGSHRGATYSGSLATLIKEITDPPKRP